jgi:hypothetical protein
MIYINLDVTIEGEGRIIILYELLTGKMIYAVDIAAG